MDDRRCVTLKDIEQATDLFFSQRANRVAEHAVTAQGIRQVARVAEGVGKNTIDAFDIEVKQGKRCDQERSGRCWMFASLNTFRFQIIKRYNLKTFELSQTYPLFFDKLEKSNWFLENILDTVHEPVEGRLVSYLLHDPISDGGQWDMFASITRKYGVVPKEAMPETACSRNTRDMDKYLTRYLRGAAKRLRDGYSAGKTTEELRLAKHDMMNEVYALLVICLGQPPQSFDVRLRDKDDKHGAFFTVKDDHIQLIGVETDKLHPSFTQVRDGKGWLRISGSAGGPAVFSQIYELKKSQVIHRMTALEVYGELDECTFDGKPFAKDKAADYIKSLPVPRDPYLYWAEIQE